MNHLTPLLLAAFLVACPKGGSVAPTADQLLAAPVLPSPEAGSYARSPATSKDPVVAALTRGRQWDAYLSGAAAGLALALSTGTGGLDGWEIREAAWRAGYPYPIANVQGWTVPKAAPAPETLVAWIAAASPHDDLGLVRARGRDGDTWVGLRARPRVSVGVQPREVALGGKITLPAVQGARYTVVDVLGNAVSGSLDLEQPFTLDRAGEWLVEVEDASGSAALFPVYVAMVPPDVPLLSHGPEPEDDDALRDRLLDVITEVRGAYGADLWNPDLLLERAAQARLRGSTEALETIARRTGVDPRRIRAMDCRAPTAEACVDQLVWRPKNRIALLTDAELWGMSCAIDRDGVSMAALVASEVDEDR